MRVDPLRVVRHRSSAPHALARRSPSLEVAYSGEVFGRLVIATLVAALALPAPALAADTVRAVPDWSMVPMSKDADRDGLIDGDGGVPTSGSRTLQPSTRFEGAGNGVAQPNERLIDGVLSWYLDDAGYPVRLNACDSSGRSYTWTITGPSGSKTLPERALRKKSCATTVLLPEGQHTLALTVRTGSRQVTETIGANVRNILMVALGDSYASGEGNPRNVQAWLQQGGPLTSFRPYWDDDPCNRSVLGAPARAALALEQADQRTSVALVNVTCSGAMIDAGVLGPQRGASTISQIERARRIVGSRPIDLVTVSIGGNDIGFGEVILSCGTTSDCATSTPTSGRLRGYPTVQDGVQARTGELAAGYARIASCLGGATCPTTGPGSRTPLTMAPDARVVSTPYPDLTRAAGGQPCTYLTYSAETMAWARDTILVPDPAPAFEYRTSAGALSLALPNATLNAQVAATAALGWRPAMGAWTASGASPIGHGVCAGSQAWVFGVTALAGFPSASFHPNPTGQQVLAQALVEAAS